MSGFARSATFGVAAAGVLAAAAPQARADIIGISTVTFQANSPACCSGTPPTIDNSTGTVSDHDTLGGYSGHYQGGSIFDTTLQSVAGGFSASFTFTATDDGHPRNGLVFVLQDDPRGAAAIGDTNEGIQFTAGGYPGNTFIQNSSGLVIDFATNKVGVEDQGSSSGATADTVGSQLHRLGRKPLCLRRRHCQCLAQLQRHHPCIARQSDRHHDWDHRYHDLHRLASLPLGGRRLCRIHPR